MWRNLTFISTFASHQLGAKQMCTKLNRRWHSVCHLAHANMTQRNANLEGSSSTHAEKKRNIENPWIICVCVSSTSLHRKYLVFIHLFFWHNPMMIYGEVIVLPGNLGPRFQSVLAGFWTPVDSSPWIWTVPEVSLCGTITWSKKNVASYAATFLTQHRISKWGWL